MANHDTPFRQSTSPQGSGFGDFFRYHGVFSPGVRLFRSLRFQAKALWISAAFLAPLALMLFYLWSAANDQIEATRLERSGINYVHPLLDLIKVAQNRRRAAANQAADLSDLQNQTRTAFEKVQAAQAELGKSFTIEKRYEPLLKAHQALLQNPLGAGGDATFKLHTDFVQAALDLIAEVADGSGLSLDPDLDTYHLMNYSVLRGPVQYENTARLRGMGTLVLNSKEMTPQRRDWLVEWNAVQSFLDKEVENSYQHGIESFPDIAKKFDMKGTDTASDAFREAITKQLMGSALSGEASAFLALGNAAVEKQTALNMQILDRLDVRLQERIGRLQSTFYTQVGISLLFLLLAAYLLSSFYKVMMGGLTEVAGHLKEITHGNLTTAPKPWGSDEAAQLMITMGEMQTSLRRIVAIVLESSGQVKTASEEISSASNDLSHRTEQAAANLEETAASMEQISSTVKQTSDTVLGAMAIVRENGVSATRGGEVIGKVVHTMDGIRTSSNKIGEIIGVIDSIAFQTNILALNAAVEAARAGEQGRGFAVVASEVRALAGRSAGAAKEIKTLISASIEQVESGTKVVADAGATIRDIVTNADRIAALMNEIGTATREQSSGVGQVGASVNELDQATQQNAALVEQTAAAASALSDQAQRLADEVSFFKLS